MVLAHLQVDLKASGHEGYSIFLLPAMCLSRILSQRFRAHRGTDNLPSGYVLCLSACIEMDLLDRSYTFRKLFRAPFALKFVHNARVALHGFCRASASNWDVDSFGSSS